MQGPRDPLAMLRNRKSGPMRISHSMGTGTRRHPVDSGAAILSNISQAPTCSDCLFIQRHHVTD